MNVLGRMCWIVLVGLAGCTSDGHFAVLGYTTRPPFDESIKTVYVPIFENNTFERGLEFEMTKNVIREIESKSPYKVTSARETADTELLGRIVSRRKLPNNLNQLGEVRDVDVGLGVEVVWKDLRSGDTLSIPNGVVRPDKTAPIPPVLITPSANYVPELGGSTASAFDAVSKQTARQIVHMMEVWNVNCSR